MDCVFVLPIYYYRVLLKAPCALSHSSHVVLQIVADNIQYAKSVKYTGTRDNAAGLDYSGILEEVGTGDDNN